MTAREKPKRPGFAVLMQGFLGIDQYQYILCKGRLHFAGAVAGKHATKMLSDRLHQMVKKRWLRMPELGRCAKKYRCEVKNLASMTFSHQNTRRSPVAMEQTVPLFMIRYS